jgi:hypothetical protein
MTHRTEDTMKMEREDIAIICCKNTVQATVIDALVLTGWTYAGKQHKQPGDKATILKFFRNTRVPG